ncbi:MULTISPECIES: DUF2225 domain-containing protein [Bacillus]|uniref:DUF2225 domain-containing protein n=1 Tax=Bacillus TaxID=1386 RepID=UPI0002D97854|nr:MULTISPECIES: DUF2225 domain-containing protein [Bacillus]
MEKIEPLFDRKIQCPLCETNYTSKKIRSKCIQVQEYDTDFCPKYKEGSINGLLYKIYVCPSCGYAFSNDFSKYFPPNSKENIISSICSKWIPHSFSGERTVEESIKTYKLAVLSATYKKEKHSLIAGLLLRIAWLNRLTKNEEQEKRFMKLAFQEYNQSFSTDDYKGTKISDVKILYLMADLSRRIGDIEQATKYLSMVIERSKSSIETGIIEMAKERWNEIREQKKVVL